MRLSPDEILAIKAAATETFGAGAIVRLFGSRLDDSRRGGDIDLLVQLTGSAPDADAIPRFRQLLDRRVGEREYDILLAIADSPVSVVAQRALAEGIVL